jgi:protease IV
MKKEKSKWSAFVIVILCLIIVSLVFGLVVGGMLGGVSGNVAVIKVHGPILVDQSGFGDVVSSTEVVKFIEKAGNDPVIKAIVVDINSPGGSAVASDEIGLALKKVNKTTVALIREVGASGGYWIASATDQVIANRMSITGSIGVIGSYFNFGKFLERYNVSYERLVAGKYKDMGSPFREMTDDEREVLQKEVDQVHEFFISEVALNRNMSVEDVSLIADGKFFLGVKAKEYGLVDSLGGMSEVEDYLVDSLNTSVSFVKFAREKSFLEQIMGVLEIFKFGVREDFKIIT